MSPHNQENPMLITRHDIEDLCVNGLKAKRSALMFDLCSAQIPFTERPLALASIETVSTELNRKLGRKSFGATAECQLLRSVPTDCPPRI
jgi:hypothetical protein